MVVGQEDQREIDEPSKAHVEVNKPLYAQVEVMTATLITDRQRKSCQNSRSKYFSLFPKISWGKNYNFNLYDLGKGFQG